MERLRPSDFDGERLRRTGPWAVCFAADWCPFCVDFLQRFDRLDGAPGLGVAIGDLTDLENPLWERFGVEIVPTLVAFRDGNAVWRRDGIGGVGLPDSAVDEIQRALHPDGARPLGTGRRRAGAGPAR
jgi:thioredoxin-like negative regulator of GroEL